MGTTVSRTNLSFDSFDQEQIGAELVLGHALTEDNRTRGFLRYSFDLTEAAEAVEDAVARVLAAGVRTADIAVGCEPVSTVQMGDAVADCLLGGRSG